MTCAIEEPQVRFSGSKETRFDENRKLSLISYLCALLCEHSFFFIFLFLFLHSKIPFAATLWKKMCIVWLKIRRRKFSSFHKPGFFHTVVHTVRDLEVFFYTFMYIYKFKIKNLKYQECMKM